MLEYRERIKSGEIIAGQELKMELDNLAEDIATGAYEYNTDKARLRMDFMEGCIRLTKSPFYGKPMRLMLWQKAFIEALYSFKMPDGNDRFKRALLLIGRKNAKALALDTRIPTPEGDKTIADIKEGDFVFDEYGKPVRVLATSEIFKAHPCYKVVFEDGDEIIADENHLWGVMTKSDRRVAKYQPRSDRKRTAFTDIQENGLRIRRTYEIADDFSRIRRDEKGMQYKYRVPVPAPLEYPRKNLFSPYILGLWLGDGSKDDNRLICGKSDLAELVEHITEEGVEVGSIKNFKGKENAYEVRLGLKEGYHYNPIREELRRLGVWMNKHIPEEYFTASVEERWALLQGLMDTDGTVSKAGQCSFTQKSETLTADVSKLLSSLAIKHNVKRNRAFIKDKDCGDVYDIHFWVDRNHSCFRFRRKTERLKQKLAPRMNYKSIVNVEYIGTRDTKCIMVDSKTGLFLAGQKNTVTHNSETCSALGNAEFILGPEGADIVCSSNNDAQASIVYDAIDLMRQLYDPKDIDTKRNQRFILNKATNTKVFKLSDRTRNKEGRNIDWAILDEVNEMAENVIAKSIEQSQSLKENPKLIEITTEGFIINGYLDRELKWARAIINGEDQNVSSTRFLPWLYTQDSEVEIFQNPRSWMKSNPSLGVIKRYDYLEEQVDIAKRSKADRIFVLSKDFNFKQNAVEKWLNPEDYTREESIDLDSLHGCFCLGFVDLAETTDLSAAMALIYNPITREKTVLARYFIPESKLLPENDDHNAGAKYKDWAQAGYIGISDGNETDLASVAEWFAQLQTVHGIKLYKCGYDQRFARDWLNAMEGFGWSKQYGDVEMVLQNAQTLNNAILLTEADLKSGLINLGANPVTRWCLSNACLKVNDQRQALVVKAENSQKIDGAVALVSLMEMFRRYKGDLAKLGGNNGTF